MRPSYIWLIFILCWSLVLGAMYWVSHTVYRLELAETRARAQTVLEENVRLALWRMDSALATLIAQENARPYFCYTPFYPAERAYTRMFAQIRAGEILIPSLLLTQSVPHILLHFQFAPDGSLLSPQVPMHNMRDLAEMRYSSGDKIEKATQKLVILRQGLTREKILAGLGSAMEGEAVPELLNNLQQSEAEQRSTIEWQARSKNYQKIAQNQLTNAFSDSAKVNEGLFKPMWCREFLLLIRRVNVNGEDYLQGCWLDWPNLQKSLCADISDILPGARLEKTFAEQEKRALRLLATLPVYLVPGKVDIEATAATPFLRVSLWLAWGGVVFAVLAVAGLLLGVISLSERRNSFVSAVTHELRTPLTTFRMYTEMLLNGMVSTAEKRQQYLQTLYTEANRLGHLVENVLTYARLERNRASRNLESISLESLLGAVQERLAERADQASMVLKIDAAKELHLRLCTDKAAVEQILFNLVDNACKYASSAQQRVIHIETEVSARHLRLGVRDYGPGISSQNARRLFKPFAKDSQDISKSASGVGLGLALSRRLARHLGGELWLDKKVKEGACFWLSLPLA